MCLIFTEVFISVKCTLACELYPDTGAPHRGAPNAASGASSNHADGDASAAWLQGVEAGHMGGEALGHAVSGHAYGQSSKQQYRCD